MSHPEYIMKTDQTSAHMDCLYRRFSSLLVHKNPSQGPTLNLQYQSFSWKMLGDCILTNFAGNSDMWAHCLSGNTLLARTPLSGSKPIDFRWGGYVDISDFWFS